jgi:hypothetical protein
MSILGGKRAAQRPPDKGSLLRNHSLDALGAFASRRR